MMNALHVQLTIGILTYAFVASAAHLIRLKIPLTDMIVYL